MAKLDKKRKTALLIIGFGVLICILVGIGEGPLAFRLQTLCGVSNIATKVTCGLFECRQADAVVAIGVKWEVPPELENQILESGFPAEVHPTDNDPEHMMVHVMAAKQITQVKPEAVQNFILHIQKHQAQLQAKAQAAAPQSKGAPGAPGGAGPGVAGTPRPGAVPAVPRGGQNPPGAIHQDQLQDPSRLPREVMQ